MNSNHNCPEQNGYSEILAERAYQPYKPSFGLCTDRLFFISPSIKKMTWHPYTGAIQSVDLREASGWSINESWGGPFERRKEMRESKWDFDGVTDPRAMKTFTTLYFVKSKSFLILGFAS